MRIALAGPEAIGEVDDALRLHVEHSAHDVLELRDVAAHDRRADRHIVERRGAGIEVHADDRLAARDQLSDEPWTDEAGRADNQDGGRHGTLPSLAAEHTSSGRCARGSRRADPGRSAETQSYG